MSIAMTLLVFYLGAGDTLPQTMRWFSLILSIHGDIQQKCYEELEACYDNHQKYVEKHCPYLCATLEEVFRFRPVGDAPMHVTSADAKVDGKLIKKGTKVQAALTAIMHDPVHFDNPDQFNPNRFLNRNGEFVRDPHVCVFSTGLRNCVGSIVLAWQCCIMMFVVKHASGLSPSQENPPASDQTTESFLL